MIHRSAFQPPPSRLSFSPPLGQGEEGSFPAVFSCSLPTSGFFAGRQIEPHSTSHVAEPWERRKGNASVLLKATCCGISDPSVEVNRRAESCPGCFEAPAFLRSKFIHFQTRAKCRLRSKPAWRQHFQEPNYDNAGIFHFPDVPINKAVIQQQLC